MSKWAQIFRGFISENHKSSMWWKLQLSISFGTQKSAKMPQTMAKMIWSFYVSFFRGLLLQNFCLVEKQNKENFVKKFRRFRNRENMSWARPVACGLLDSWNFCSLLASISWVFAWKGRWNLTAWSSTYALGSVGGGATFKTQPKEKILFNMILMKIRHHIAQID